PPAIIRNKNGGLAEGARQKLMESSEQELGAWYPVHHGYEVQICDDSDEFHRTGSIYSLAKAALSPTKRPTDWKTLISTLKEDLVLLDNDGKHNTRFAPDNKDVPKERKWFEPKREPKRPKCGFIGLQSHDPGDVVWFKEVSVRPIEKMP